MEKSQSSQSPNSLQEPMSIKKLDASWKFITDQYELLDYLGKGSNGQVVKARSLNDGTTVAIKFLKNSMQNTYDARKLISEVRTLRKLSAVNGNVFTTKLYDIIVPDSFSVDDDKPIPYIFIVMEYLELTMSQVISDPDIRFELDHVIVLMYNMLCCLHYFHSAGLMHRDIKPANILLNDDCVSKLCDFGLSRPCLKEKKYLVGTPY